MLVGKAGYFQDGGLLLNPLGRGTLHLTWQKAEEQAYQVLCEVSLYKF